ncbi:MAG: hypothetical protein KFB93_00650 [Simkaniaceae bacterium]|nr:MAG: hypothetical protein KFB93_00650 [Simkaniaceae bacterium]
MKKLVLLMGIATLSYAANGSTNYQSNGSQSTTQPRPQTTVPSDCSHLSETEKAFASQLSDMHRTMFCRHFSVSQRLRAMALNSSEVETLTGQQTTISPDQAVEAVMKDARQDQSQSNGDGSQQQQGQQQQGQNPYSNYSYPSDSSNSKQQSNPYTNY